MKADTTCDRQASIRERRSAYEAEITNALLDETSEERDERLALVRVAEAMLLRALHLDDEPVEN
jgi:hypothetical protein